MAEEKRTELQRIFEQAPDAISFYCDFGQVTSTGAEVIVQFYETIPGPPEPSGGPRNIRTRLRATVTLSYRHAKNIGELLMREVERRK